MMKKLLISTVFIVFSYYLTVSQVLVKCNAVLMGSLFEITIVGKDSIDAKNNVQKVIDEIIRIEELISDWKPSSQISQVNQNAGIVAVQVDREVLNITQTALGFSKYSEGAFDISFAAMDKIWKFDGTMEKLPDSITIQKAIRHIGWQKIEIDTLKSTIFLSQSGMKIGFGATGKGYAADKGRKLMLSQGVQAGIVNASGDLAVWGNRPNGKAWKIGVEHPFKAEKFLKKIKIRNGAVVTSGDYQKNVEFDGIRYSHIIHPKTGMPVTELASVTVIGPSAEIANGISTSIMVLGLQEGLYFLRLYPDYAAIIVSNEKKIVYSDNFKKVKKAVRNKNKQ